MLSELLSRDDGESWDSLQAADSPRPWESVSAGIETCMIEGGAARSSNVILDQHVETRRAMCLQASCPAYARGRAIYCAVHGGTARCQVAEGCAKAARPSSRFCGSHGGGKRCTHEGCSKLAQGLTSLCLKHGGGYRCTYIGCTKGSRGSCGLCRKHRSVLERLTSEASLPIEAHTSRHMHPTGHDAGLQGQGSTSPGLHRPLDCSDSAISLGAPLPHWSRGSAAPMQSNIREERNSNSTTAGSSLTLGDNGQFLHTNQSSLKMAPQLPACTALLEKELLPLFPMQSPIMTEGHSQHSMISHFVSPPPDAVSPEWMVSLPPPPVPTLLLV